MEKENTKILKKIIEKEKIVKKKKDYVKERNREKDLDIEKENYEKSGKLRK